MALYRCRFVDSIVASPGVRLDINDGVTFRVMGGDRSTSARLDFSPPDIRRAKSSTILSDGDVVTATVLANRSVAGQLLVTGATRAALDTALSALHTELSRERNILEIRTGTVSRFLRTFASPNVTIMDEGQLNRAVVTLSLEAEPYAYGLLATQAGLSVSNDPAAGTRPCYLDITGVTGDVLTPAIITITTPTTVTFAMGMRRHGTPSTAIPWVIQAETFTRVAPATLPGNDAAMSGAGSNYVRITFPASTSPIGVPQLTTTLASLTTDHRGTYRVFARVRRTTANTDVIQMRIAYAGSATDWQYYGDTYTVHADTIPQLVDLGTITIPISNDPGTDATGAPLGVGDTFFGICSGRVAAVGTFLFDIDYVVLVPADEDMTIIDCPSNQTTADLVLDGDRSAYYYLLSGKVRSAQMPTVTGGIAPLLAPNQTNRLVFLRDVMWRTAENNLISESTTVAVSWLPRFLYI